MSSGKLSNAGTFSLTYNLPYWYYKFLQKNNMGNISSMAERRLAMIEFYYQIKDVFVVCRSFKISRKTFYKWKKRYEDSGKKLLSLEDLSRTPSTKRKTTFSFKTELKIKHLREKYIRLRIRLSCRSFLRKSVENMYLNLTLPM